MWVRFTTDYDFSPDAKGGRVTIAYKAGMVQNVTRECAEKAEAAGAGTRTVTTSATANQPEEPESSPLDAGDEGNGAVLGCEDR
jgi:hypothetical protein